MLADYCTSILHTARFVKWYKGTLLLLAEH